MPGGVFHTLSAEYPAAPRRVSPASKDEIPTWLLYSQRLVGRLLHLESKQPPRLIVLIASPTRGECDIKC
jgi:hypothetical protein